MRRRLAATKSTNEQRLKKVFSFLVQKFFKKKERGGVAAGGS